VERLRGVEARAGAAPFQDRWRAAKQANKTELARWMRATHGLLCDPAALLDAQCKRIHEYKRQHLKLLHASALLERIRTGNDLGVPRTILLAGKAAPAYRTAKLIIRLAHGVADAIAAHPRARDSPRRGVVP